MRKFGVLWTGSLMLLLTSVFYSCETEIDINTPNLEVPIVYCLLNTADSVQYLKLNKTYLLESAALQNPPLLDSQYFEGNIQIVLEKWENNKPVEFYEFEPSTEIPKDTGFFPSGRNTIYRTEARIEAEDLYMLNIYVENHEKIVYAQTKAVGLLNVIDPIDLKIRKVSLNIGVNYTTRWKPVENAGIYQVVVRFWYKETKEGLTVEKYLDWPQAFSNPISNVDYLSRDISGTRFFYILADGIPADPGVIREVIGVDFYIMSAGTELKFYIESTAPSDGALMEKPIYSNITNGIGVFSTIATRKMMGMDLASTTIDSIAYGQLTKELMFLDHNGIRE